MRRMRESFAEQIDQVQSKVTRLASVVVDMLAQAMDALVRQDEQLAERVIYQDDLADDLTWRSSGTACVCWRCSSPWPGTCA